MAEGSVAPKEERMPVGVPEFGEVWTTSDATSGRLMQGIVADVTPTRVLFVSLSGIRVAVPRGRLGTTWNFVQPTPRRIMPACERVGCGQGGMIQYERAGDTGRFEFVCPRHVPSGVQCRITVDYNPSVEVTRIIRPGFECRSSPCPSCSHTDPAEDVRLAAFPARLWACSACNARWMTIPIIPDGPFDLSLLNIISNELLRWQYQEESVLILGPEAWTAVRRSPEAIRGGEANVIRLNNGTEIVPSFTLFTEQVRAQFHAVVRLRQQSVRMPERRVQRLGGAPNRGGVVGAVSAMEGFNRALESLGRTVAAVPPGTLVYRPPGAPGDTAAAAEALHRLRELEGERALFQGPTNIEEEVLGAVERKIERDSQWVQRKTGCRVEVVETLKAMDGSEVISSRRRAADGLEPSVSMTREDFLNLHRPHNPSSEKPEPAKPTIEVSIDEEWGNQDGSSIVVTHVDPRKEIVYGDDTQSKKHRSVPFSQFSAGVWRKIVRKSVYDRLRQLSATTMIDED